MEAVWAENGKRFDRTLLGYQQTGKRRNIMLKDKMVAGSRGQPQEFGFGFESTVSTVRFCDSDAVETTL